MCVCVCECLCVCGCWGGEVEGGLGEQRVSSWGAAGGLGDVGVLALFRTGHRRVDQSLQPQQGFAPAVRCHRPRRPRCFASCLRAAEALALCCNASLRRGCRRLRGTAICDPSVRGCGAYFADQAAPVPLRQMQRVECYSGTTVVASLSAPVGHERRDASPQSRWHQVSRKRGCAKHVGGGTLQSTTNARGVPISQRRIRDDMQRLLVVQGCPPSLLRIVPRMRRSSRRQRFAKWLPVHRKEYGTTTLPHLTRRTTC